MTFDLAIVKFYSYYLHISLPFDSHFLRIFTRQTARRIVGANNRTRAIASSQKVLSVELAATGAADIL